MRVSDLVNNDVYIRWKDHDPNANPPKGESFLLTQKRAVDKLNEISSKNDNKTIVITAHGGVIKTLTAYFLNLSIEQWSKKLPYVSNASVTKVVYENGKYTLIETVDSYLGDLKTEMPKGI
jgi:broad specificity phosphatase PhoE